MKSVVILTVLTSFVLPAVAAHAVSPETDQQVLGAWKLQYTTPEGDVRNPIVVVGRQFEQYVAWYVANDQPQSFQNVRLQGDKLVATIEPRERPDVKVTLEARLKAENECEGTATHRSKDGDSGSWNFSGQRMPLSSFDEVMTWKLDFSTPDGDQHVPTVTVVTKDGKWYAWYSDKDHELPAAKLSVDGNRVEMKMTAQSREGEKVDVTFRGTVEGDQVRGNADYDMASDAGSFSFTGKRAS